MADQPERGLTPEQEDEVRRLLAEARHDEPMPPGVVARMDRVLDDLAEEPSRRAPVVDLAARRRRVASLLVAAAAVVVVGIGIGQLVGTTNGGGAGSDSAAGDADAGAAQSSEQDNPDDQALRDAPSPQAQEPGRELVLGKSFEIDPGEFSRDVRRAQRYTAEHAPADLVQLNGTDAFGAMSCSADFGPGTYVSIRYGDVPAILVLRPPEGDTQVADVYFCDQSTPDRSLTLRIPPP